MKAISDFFSSHGIDPFLAGLVAGGVLFALARAAFSGGKASRSSGLRAGFETVSVPTRVSRSETMSVRISVNDVERELTPAQSAEVLDALRTGNKIGAIKAVRTATGLGLKEAKDLVDALDRNRSQRE